MKRTTIIILAVIVFLAAMGFTAYPIISSKVNAKYASEIQTTYEEVLQEADNSDLIEAKEKAIAYNNSITPGASVEDAYSQEALLTATRDYECLLNIAGDGIMGYVKIPKIGVQLPIYHGTDNDSLERGIGHLLGSSLPVGGDSTHTILTAHSGMASQKMFSDLPQLEIGDVFYLAAGKFTVHHHKFNIVELTKLLDFRHFAFAEVVFLFRVVLFLHNLTHHL